MTVNEYQKMAMATLNPALAKKDVLINGCLLYTSPSPRDA